MSLSIFGPEPPPSISKAGPVMRRVPRKPPAEVVDIAARQSAKTALTAVAELNERLGAYGLSENVELIAVGVRSNAGALEGLRAEVAAVERKGVAIYDSLEAEVHELRQYVFAREKADRTAKLIIAASFVVLALCTIGNALLYVLGR